MKKILQRLFFVLLFSGSASCTNELDFNQFDDLEALPSYEASIFYLESPEEVINQVEGVDVFTQNYNFEAFSSDIFADRVVDGVITYVLENTTSKELEITIELLDEEGNTNDTEVFRVLPAPTAKIQREVAYGDAGNNIEIITSLSTIRVTARNLGDNTSTSSLPNPLIILKSSGAFRVRLK